MLRNESPGAGVMLVASQRSGVSTPGRQVRPVAPKVRWFHRHKIRAAWPWFFGIGGVSARQARVCSSNCLIRMVGYSRTVEMHLTTPSICATIKSFCTLK